MTTPSPLQKGFLMNRKPLALACLLGLASTALALGATSAAQAQGVGTTRPRGLAGYVPGTMGIPQPEPRVTLSFTNYSLARSLSEIFKQSGFSYRVLAEMGVTRYSLNVQTMPVSRALQMLLDQDKSNEPLVFRFSKFLTGGGEYIIDRELLEVGYSRSEGENRVSAANARITKILPLVFKAMKVPFRIEPDVPPVLVSLQLRPQMWEPVVQQVLLEAFAVEPGLTYSRDGETYVVHLQKTPVNGLPGMPARRVKLTTNETPLRTALQQLFEGSAWKFQVADAVKDTKVTYATTAEPELSVLQVLLRQCAAGGQPVTYREGKGLLYIEPGFLPGDYLLARTTAPTTPQLNLITYDIKFKRIKQVAEDLAIRSGATITVAPNVPDLLVPALKVDKATLDQALDALKQAMKKSLPNLIVAKDGMDYIIAVQ